MNVDQEENSREPKLVAIHASSNAVSWSGNAISRSGPLRRPTADVIAEDAINLVRSSRPPCSDEPLRPLTILVALRLGAFVQRRLLGHAKMGGLDQSVLRVYVELRYDHF